MKKKEFISLEVNALVQHHAEPGGRSKHSDSTPGTQMPYCLVEHEALLAPQLVKRVLGEILIQA